MFSIKTLLLSVAFAAVAVMALLNASANVARLALVAVVIANCTAIVGAIVLTRSSRWSFWMGFAVFGGMYFLLSLVHGLSYGLGASSPVPTSFWHLTPIDPLLDAVCASIERRGEGNGEDGFRSGRDFIDGGYDSTGRGTYLVPVRGHFRRVGNAVFNIILGIVGGLVGMRFQRTASGITANKPTPAPATSATHPPAPETADLA